MTLRSALAVSLCALALTTGASRADDLDAKSVTYVLPADIQWKSNPAGTYVVHYGRGIHYDGAKQDDTIIALHGIGPATITPAEQ